MTYHRKHYRGMVPNYNNQTPEQIKKVCDQLCADLAAIQAADEARSAAREAEWAAKAAAEEPAKPATIWDAFIAAKYNAGGQ
jgi:hypothetical protein